MPNIDGTCKSSAREFAESNCSARDVEDSSHSMWLASTGAHARDTSHANATATNCLQWQPKRSSNTTVSECLGHRRVGVHRCLLVTPSAFKLHAIELATCTTLKLSAHIRAHNSETIHRHDRTGFFFAVLLTG